MCAARFTEAIDCFWGCEKACKNKGFTVKQCAASIELEHVAGCLGEALAGWAGAAPLDALAASALRGSLRGTRCICSTADPAGLMCAARFTKGVDCFWGCREACENKGFRVKQCAAWFELKGVAGC